VQVGEWVIAVGNPFSLSINGHGSIVSAKGRRIGILQDKFPSNLLFKPMPPLILEIQAVHW
jgi:S1-C subfamily serine protease